MSEVKEKRLDFLNDLWLDCCTCFKSDDPVTVQSIVARWSAALSLQTMLDADTLTACTTLLDIMEWKYTYLSTHAVLDIAYKNFVTGAGMELLQSEAASAVHAAFKQLDTAAVDAESVPYSTDAVLASRAKTLRVLQKHNRQCRHQWSAEAANRCRHILCSPVTLVCGAFTVSIAAARVELHTVTDSSRLFHAVVGRSKAIFTVPSAPEVCFICFGYDRAFDLSHCYTWDDSACARRCNHSGYCLWEVVDRSDCEDECVLTCYLVGAEEVQHIQTQLPFPPKGTPDVRVIRLMPR